MAGRQVPFDGYGPCRVAVCLDLAATLLACAQATSPVPDARAGRAALPQAWSRSMSGRPAGPVSHRERAFRPGTARSARSGRRRRAGSCPDRASTCRLLSHGWTCEPMPRSRRIDSRLTTRCCGVDVARRGRRVLLDDRRGAVVDLCVLVGLTRPALLPYWQRRADRPRPGLLDAVDEGRSRTAGRRTSPAGSIVAADEDASRGDHRLGHGRRGPGTVLYQQYVNDLIDGVRGPVAVDPTPFFAK